MRKSTKTFSLLCSQTSYLMMTSALVIAIFLSSQKNNQASIQEITDSCTVITIIDGDTVTAICKLLSQKEIRIRLAYIDAPESQQQQWGEKSTQYLHKILSRGNYRVRINFSGKDVYHRYLGELFLADHNVNIAMVEKGMARVYRNYHPPQNYIQAMSNAKKHKRGIWNKKGLQQNPQRFRRLAY